VNFAHLGGDSKIESEFEIEIEPGIESRSPAAHFPQKIERILIVRLSAMGDVIHTLPAVSAIRQAFPKAHIGWLIEERWAELLCAPGFPRQGPRSPQRPLVDEIHTVKLKTWQKSLFSLSTLQRIATIWNDVRDLHYQVALDLQGAIRSAVLAKFSGANVIIGAADPRESAASLWYSRQIIATGKHVVQQTLSIVQVLTGTTGVIKNSKIELPCDPQSETQIEERLANLGLRDFAILNPGAGWGAKQWPPGRYAEVARKLAARGIRSVLNYGPGEEELARIVEHASAGAAQAMSCTISELIALTRRGRLFMGGDTGPLHLAAALQIPVVAIFGPTDPARNGPYGTRSIVLRSPQSITSHTRRAAPDQGLLQISTDAVTAAADELLSGGSQ
jgi:heptosyltransferase I